MLNKKLKLLLLLSLIGQVTSTITFAQDLKFTESEKLPDPYSAVVCVSDPAEIKKDFLPLYSLEQISSLLISREGDTPDSYMRALGIHNTVYKDNIYKLTPDGLVVVTVADYDELMTPIRLEKVNKKVAAPLHVSVEGEWDKTDTGEANEANILGGNGQFIYKGHELNIPLIEATKEALAYYGAHLLKMGDQVLFDDDHFPIWTMQLGVDYVQDYIMKKGGGLYIEFHNDKPHFHMPLSSDSGGGYILGKKIGKNLYNVTAFQIPHGKAVYTCRGAIHCDAALTGSLWAVGYTEADAFSTVLLRNQDKEKLKVNFIQK